MCIPVLYGSQGGNSFEIAKLLIRKIEEITNKTRPGIACHALPMNDISVEGAAGCPLLIFVCSTTGDGAAPYNMQEFWSSLKRRSLCGTFSESTFALFGLGDSSYPKYNFAAKRLFNRLLQLGGTPLLDRGDGNEQDECGVYTSLLPWIENLCSAVRKDPSLLARVHKHKREPQRQPEEVYRGKLLRRRCITGEGYERPVYDCVFEIDRAAFYPGDVLSIRPKNTDAASFMQSVGLEGDDALFREEVDYQRVPMFHFFSLLCSELGKTAFLEEPSFREKLEELAASFSLYVSYVAEPKRSIREVLNELRVRVSRDFPHFPTIMPRYYTISRGSPPQFSITVGIAKTGTEKRPRLGLCSSFVLHMQEGDIVAVGIRRSQLVLGKKVLVVCTGTGVSLARAVLHYAGNSPSTEIDVLFGFRSLFSDLLYHDELVGEKTEALDVPGQFVLLSLGKNKRIYMVPSRIKDDVAHNRTLERPNPHIPGEVVLSKKNYVQNVLRHIDLAGKTILVGGNSRLTKIIPPLLHDLMKERPNVQFECW